MGPENLYGPAGGGMGFFRPMQVSSATGLSISRLIAPVAAPRPTGAADTLRTAQDTTRTTPPATGPGRSGLTLRTSRPVTPNGNPDAFLISPALNRDRLEQARTGLVQSIRDRVQALSDRVNRLLDTGSFNTRSANVRPRDVLAVAPENDTPLGSNRFRSTRLSAGQTLASDEFPSGSALGLSGTFHINGVPVTVAPQDGLSSIRDRINRGEDTNGNRVLDGAEDLNANGQLDIIQVAAGESGPGLFVVEDVNGNGILDPSEDANGNDRLDGGTGENRVTASLSRNRLLLTSTTGGASAIALSDPDGVLLALGFFELNAKGLPIEKEAQFDFDRQTPTDLNTVPLTAQLEVGGQALESDTDTFTNALENAVVELKKTAEGGIEVEITFDAETALAEIQNLADEFNTVVADVNRALHGNQAFAEDPDLNGVRQNLTDPNEPAAVEPAEDVLKTFDRITPPVSGTPLADSGVLRFGDFFNSNTAQTIEKGVRPEPPTTGGLLIKQLEPVGIEIQPGDTVEINSTKLEEALKNGNENVQDIFFDSENGLLAFLKARLEPLLNEDFGPLPAGDESIQETQTPVQRGNARLRERLLDSLTENRQTRNLIAIV